MESIIATLCARLEGLVNKRPPPSRRRILIAFAGTPGSGKSTISAALTKAFNAKRRDSITVLPMDGFHHPKSILSKMKSTECPFERRGAPFTFDAEAFIDLIRKLRDTPVTEQPDPALAFYAPSFDHSVKDPVADDIYISSSQQIVILEGNYLLLNEAPWNQIQDLVDETWFVSVSREIAKKRLIKRHLMAGIETTRDAAAARAEGNDLLNADMITRKMIRPDIVVASLEVAQVL